MAAGPLSNTRLNEYQQNGFVLERRCLTPRKSICFGGRPRKTRAARPALFRQRRWRRRHRAAVLVESSRRHDLRHVRALRNNRELRRELLEGEVYHYHSKMIMKDAEGRRRVGLASGLRLLVSERRPVPAALAALHCGRSGHAGKRLPAGAQGLAPSGPHRPRPDRRSGGRRHGTGARNPKRLELVYVEMAPGDVLFFHANLLHRSDQNRPTIRAGR